MANVNIRVDDALKLDAERVFSELGLTMSAATNMFYKQVVRYRGIPFELRLEPFWSSENQAHLEAAVRSYDSGASKPVRKSMEELEEMANE